MTDSPWLVAKLQVALKLKPYLPIDRSHARHRSFLGIWGLGEVGGASPLGVSRSVGTPPSFTVRRNVFFLEVKG